MSDPAHPFFQLLEDDTRYKFEAYQFMREALSYGQDVLDLGTLPPVEPAGEPEPSTPDPDQGDEPQLERHLTGQQLCEAIRKYAVEQYGYMAQVVLNSWGIHSTSDFGDIVYNLIGIGMMKKSESDLREDFNDVYDFDVVFRQEFNITMPDT